MLYFFFITFFRNKNIIHPTNDPTLTHNKDSKIKALQEATSKPISSSKSAVSE